MRKRPRRQMDLFPQERIVAPWADTPTMRRFVHVCLDNYRDALERHLPPDVVRTRREIFQKVWRALDDARVRDRTRLH